MIPLSVFIEGAETMEKLTDAEVATALEKCVCGRATDCDSCQFRKKEYCKDDMLREAYDLIKRKDAEIERLKAEINYNDEGKGLILKINGANGYFPIEFIKEAINTHVEIDKAKSAIRKEFAERLKKHEGRRGVPIATIDNLLEEMEKEDNDEC